VRHVLSGTRAKSVHNCAKAGLSVAKRQSASEREEAGMKLARD